MGLINIWTLRLASIVSGYLTIYLTIGLNPAFNNSSSPFNNKSLSFPTKPVVNISTRNFTNDLVSGSKQHLEEPQAYQWIIENFLAILNSPDLMQAQKFHFDAGQTKSGQPVSFVAYLNVTRKPSNNPVISIWVRRYPEILANTVAAEDSYLELKIEIGRRNRHSFYTSPTVSYMANSKGGLMIASLHNLTNQSKLSEVLMGGALFVHLYVNMISRVETTMNPFDALIATHRDTFAKNAQNDLAELQYSDVDPDLTLVSDGGTMYSVNSQIFKARCPRFDMFWDELEDKHLNSKTLKMMSAYIYTGDLAEVEDWGNKEVIYELVYFASKCHMTDWLHLFDDTFGHLCTQNVDEAGELLEISRKLKLANAEMDVRQCMRVHGEDNMQIGVWSF